MDYQLIINNEYVDLDPKTTIAVTLQRLDIGDISKSFVSRTNLFKALLTEKNNRIFGYSNEIKTTNRTPYGYLDCVLQSTTGSLVFAGKCFVKGIEDQSYQIAVYEDAVSLLTALGDNDLSAIAWDSQAWNNSDIDTARLATSGFISAVINWGQSSAIYTVDRFLPMYYYKSLIQKIFSFAGYGVTGSILNSTDLTELVCTPFTRFKYKDSAQFSAGYLTPTSYTDTQVLTIDQAFININTNLVSYGFSSVPDTFVANINASIFFDNINLAIDPLSTSSYDLKAMAFNGVTTRALGAANFITSGTNTTRTISLTNVELIQGETIFCAVYFNKDATYPTDQLSVTVSTSANTILTIMGTSTVARSKPIWRYLANNKKLSDIIRDFFVRFSIVYKRVGDNIELMLLEDILNDTAGAVDWTNKRVTEKQSVVFSTSYAQSNYFLHENNIDDKTYGSGILAVANQTLKTLSDFFTSVFSNAARWINLGYDVMTIPAYTNAATSIGDLENEIPLCIGTLKSRTNETAITFDAISRTDYKLAYFIDPSKSKDTGFAFFLGKYYATLTRALQNNKTVKQNYLLTELDIANYDPFKMVYDNGTYYLINKINNFVPGKVTQVELFKIN